MRISIHYCYANCWVHWDKQLVEQILQLGAIKLLQKTTAQQDDITKTVPSNLKQWKN